MPQELSIETATHGRVLIAASAAPAGTIVAFHGYGQSADEILNDARKIPGADEWTIVAPQALHRFYARGDERVVASWMTRQDRETAIADNVAYIDRVLQSENPQIPKSPSLLVFLGFSQGVAMAYRAALVGAHVPAGVIALAGDVPPELKAGGGVRDWPRVLVGGGDADRYYTAERVAADESFFRERGVAANIVRFHGGHLFTTEFRAAAGEFLHELRRR